MLTATLLKLIESSNCYETLYRREYEGLLKVKASSEQFVCTLEKEAQKLLILIYAVGIELKNLRSEPDEEPIKRVHKYPISEKG